MAGLDWFGYLVPKKNQSIQKPRNRKYPNLFPSTQNILFKNLEFQLKPEIIIENKNQKLKKKVYIVPKTYPKYPIYLTYTKKIQVL